MTVTSDSLARTATEAAVVGLVHDSRADLVGLIGDLVACDTTARGPSDPARDEQRLQQLLADRLTLLGADVELWEPDPITAEHPYISAAHDFLGRPQLVATLAGTGGGRSLLLNGHIDAVDVGDLNGWRSDPFVAEVRDGNLYGRGTADMKGGLACYLLALEVLQRVGVRLRGDVVYCANTDEESSGIGGWAAVQHGVRADAGICGEPTGFDVWSACRGATAGVLTVPGRAGHAELPARHYSVGGGVNAIERALPLIDSLRRLREDWNLRPDQHHPLLSPSSVLPTVIAGGNWVVTYPEQVEVTCDVQFLPHMANRDGSAGAVQDEVERWVEATAHADPWLRDHPPTWRWLNACPPAEVDSSHDLVTTALTAASSVGRPSRVAGLDSWHDASTFTRLGHTPTVSFGPGLLTNAHASNEYVAVDDLVDFTAAVALLIMRWCGKPT